MTYDMIRAGYVRNIASMEKMATKARAVAPRKFSGYTVAEIEAHIATFKQLAVLSDADLAAHLARVRATCATAARS